MAKENETVADIIAEMRGARTEFPFVYLMGEPDTPEVIDLRTKEITEPRKINIRRVTVKELADRLEAAHKREKAAIEADALAVGGIVEAERQRERGDCAKMREAIEAVLLAFNYGESTIVNQLPFSKLLPMLRKCVEALAAPPRNCDIGTAEEQAERYGRYCDKFTSDGMHCEQCPCCGKIPFGKCEFAWSQMPYNEGGNDGR